MITCILHMHVILCKVYVYENILDKLTVVVFLDRKEHGAF